MGFRSTTLTEESEALYFLTINNLLNEALRAAGDGGVVDITLSLPELKDVAELLINNEGSIIIKS